MGAKAIVGACVGPLWFDVTVDFHFRSQSHLYESKKEQKKGTFVSLSLCSYLMLPCGVLNICTICTTFFMSTATITAKCVI